uniref:Triple gene block protein 1 n=1 Tax=Nerine virus X TaxID=333348 RepID=G9B9X0_9VIRU|nr:triple gene block protein 1 [Nerine virus X]
MENIIQQITNPLHTHIIPNIQTIIIHCCAGAGKTTFIRELLEQFPEVQAYTHSQHLAAEKTISGRNFHHFSEYQPGYLDVIDEYLAGPIPETCHFCFADPYQYNIDALPAHFICNKSYRFGTLTADYLNSLGYQVRSAGGSDSIRFIDLAHWEPEGICITQDSDILNLLTRHGISAYHPCETLGLQFNCVDYLVPKLPTPATADANTYLALTRHSSRLNVVSDAADSAT